MVGSLARGLDDARRGAAFLAARPRLWKLLIVPFAVAALLIGLVIWAAFSWLEPMVADLLSFLPAWLSALITAAKLLLLLLFLAGAYFVYVAVAMLLLAPFCEMISEAIEAEVTGAEAPPFSLGVFLRDLLLGVAHAARRLFSYLVTIAALFLLGALIPLVGPPIAAALGALVTARAAAYDAYDAVWARKGFSYQDKMKALSADRGRTYGLGAAVAALLAVPVANLAALPIGAAGATLAHAEQPAQSPSPRST